jgi:glutaredoxin
MTQAQATIHRMVMPGHICPFGLKALHLLRRQGFAVEDHPLRSRAQTDAFKEAQGVATTPQIFIDGVRIGGYDALRQHLGLRVPQPGQTSYRPILALFAMTGLMALMASHVAVGALFTLLALRLFIAISMCVLAILKLQDVERFSTMFLNYDLLARRFVPYAYAYPFAEGLAGVLMLGGVLDWLSIPLALVIGSVGAVSVFKAVYIERRSLNCACVGGGSSVPLGFVSLLENVMMVAMALWMLAVSL